MENVIKLTDTEIATLLKMVDVYDYHYGLDVAEIKLKTKLKDYKGG